MTANEEWKRMSDFEKKEWTREKRLDEYSKRKLQELIDDWSPEFE
jgi:hypothetical protein